MSDQLGRRRPLLVGMLRLRRRHRRLRASRPPSRLLIAFRLLQGLAGRRRASSSPGPSYATCTTALAMARFFSTLMLISGVAPIIAPAHRRPGPALHRLAGRLLRPHRRRRRAHRSSSGGGCPRRCAPEQRHSGGVARGPAHHARPARRPRLHRLHARGRLRLRRALRVRLGLAVRRSRRSTAPPRRPSACSSCVNSIGLVAVGQINGKILVGRVSLDKVLAFGLCVIGTAARRAAADDERASSATVGPGAGRRRAVRADVRRWAASCRTPTPRP